MPVVSIIEIFKILILIIITSILIRFLIMSLIRLYKDEDVKIVREKDFIAVRKRIEAQLRRYGYKIDSFDLSYFSKFVSELHHEDIPNLIDKFRDKYGPLTDEEYDIYNGYAKFATTRSNWPK